MMPVRIPDYSSSSMPGKLVIKKCGKVHFNGPMIILLYVHTETWLSLCEGTAVSILPEMPAPNLKTVLGHFYRMIQLYLPPWNFFTSEK